VKDIESLVDLVHCTSETSASFDAGYVTGNASAAAEFLKTANKQREEVYFNVSSRALFEPALTMRSSQPALSEQVTQSFQTALHAVTTLEELTSLINAVFDLMLAIHCTGKGDAAATWRCS
jgi:hypothetical protein